jgi:hypothetical protein
LLSAVKNPARRHAPALVAWQSSRQLAGIPHANAAAPRVFLSLAGSGIGKLTSELIGSLRSKNNYSWFFVRAASFSGPAFSASPHQAVSRLVTALPKTPARLARFPLKPTPMQEGWGRGCFVNKATDG